jgi:hypothetical protein
MSLRHGCCNADGRDNRNNDSMTRGRFVDGWGNMSVSDRILCLNINSGELPLNCNYP